MSDAAKLLEETRDILQQFLGFKGTRCFTKDGTAYLKVPLFKEVDGPEGIDGDWSEEARAPSNWFILAEDDYIMNTLTADDELVLFVQSEVSDARDAGPLDSFFNGMPSDDSPYDY